MNHAPGVLHVTVVQAQFRAAVLRSWCRRGNRFFKDTHLKTDGTDLEQWFPPRP